MRQIPPAPPVVKVIILCILWMSGQLACAGTFQTISIQQNDAFRRDVMRYVQQVGVNYVNGNTSTILGTKNWFNGGSPSFYLIRWAANITIYVDGNKVGGGQANESSLSSTLNKAATQAFQTAHLDSQQLKKARLKITFYYPPDARQYSMISDNDQVMELIGNIIPVRQMDTALLKNRIQEEKSYLLRMMEPNTHAFFKRYDPNKGQYPFKLRTIYTASSLYTLLNVQNVAPDPTIEKQIQPMADFLLMMQEKQGENAGAFHYSYDKRTKQKDERFGAGRFVVGTASKTIFTLLMLYDRTHDEKYLNVAKQAGNWLIKKVDDKGHVNPVVEHYKGQLIRKTQQSFLYSGQVLSALSRLYAVTHDKAYYDTATQIANREVEYVQQHSAFVGDDYRAPNSVTTSWVVMSLVDYAKINSASIYRTIISLCARELVNRQIQAPWDAFNEGRLMDIITSSGNGWVNEVMTELYPFCKAHKMKNCRDYRRFVIHSSRWLVQNVYTSANSFAIKNPAIANGGVIRNFAESTIRTDAVCHGLNSLVGLLKIIGPENQMLQFLPEMPFNEVLGLLEMGGQASNIQN